MSALLQSPAQLVGLPTCVGAQNDDVHASMQVRLKPDTTNTEARSITSAAIITYVVSGFSRTRHRIRMLRHEYYVLSKRDARSTAGSSRPAWKVRPLDVLVSHTSAGLKSIGSIL